MKIIFSKSLMWTMISGLMFIGIGLCSQSQENMEFKFEGDATLKGWNRTQAVSYTPGPDSLNLTSNGKDAKIYREITLPAGNYLITAKGKGPTLYICLRKNWTQDGTIFKLDLFSPHEWCTNSAPLHLESEQKLWLIVHVGARKSVNTAIKSIVIEQLKSNAGEKAALPLAGTWTLFTGVEPPAQFTAVPQDLPSQFGKPVGPRTISLVKDTINIAALVKNYSIRDCAVLYNEFSCPAAATVKMGFSADYWMEIYLNGKIIYSTMTKGNETNAYTPDDHIVDVPCRKGRNILAVKVLSGSNGWRFVCGIPHDFNVVYTADEHWKAVDMSSIQVKAGSALDLSYLLDAPAGKFGRAIVDANGQLTFEKTPLKTVRFQAANGTILFQRWYQKPDSTTEFKEKVRHYADAMARQGYNLCRLMDVDRFCSGSQQDLTINPRWLDQWDYIISEFKRRGIYLQVGVAAYNLYSKKWLGKEHKAYKLMMYLGDENVRRRFRFGTETLLNHVNPYTGLAWKDDPCIALMEIYNEQYDGIALIHQIAKEHPEVYARLEHRWRQWLIGKFSREIPAAVTRELNGKNLVQASIPNMRKRGALANEFAIFCLELVKNNNYWCERVIRGTGYKGLITQNAYKNLLYSLAGWETVQVVDNHSYYCHPANGRVNPGATVEQESSIERRGNYWCGLNSGRLAGRPIFVGEFNHAFWNPYQYEAGLLFSAYSALQGFSSIALHCNPVQLEVRGRMDYNPGPVGCINYNFLGAENPVVRANEFLRSCIFTRGDVQKALHKISLSVPEKYCFTDANAWQAVSSEQSKLGLLTGFSLEFPWASRAAGTAAPGKSDLTIHPAGSSAVSCDGWFDNVVDTKDKLFSLDACVKDLKQKGILSTDNISDPSRNIFQSDTGEITMRANEKFMKVVTPKTEGVCIMAGKSETLGLLTVNSSSVQCCVALASVDGKPLRNCCRMVLVYNTQVVNSGMELSPNHVTMRKVGTAPVLMQTGRLNVTVRTDKKGIACYALDFDGTRREKIPVFSENGSVNIKIDTALLTHGPTPFFELIDE